MLTKEHAQAIASKFGARIKPGKSHDIAVICHAGKRVAQFGIRRGSRKDQGHNHIPSSIHLSPRDTLLFAQCDISVEDWIARMREKGMIH